MNIPIWVVQEIGRLKLELLAAQQRIRELEKHAEEHGKATEHEASFTNTD